MKYQYFNQTNPFTGEVSQFGQRANYDGSFTSFLFDPANTDYQQFKKDIEEGVELQDADGNKMTKAKVTAFLKTLP